MQNHPNNDAKVLMVDVLEKADINYSQWARSKVEEVKQLVTRRNVRVNAEGMNLNEQRLTQKLEVVERQMGIMVKSIDALQRTILETNAGRNASIGRAGGANGYNDDGHDDDDDDGTGGGAGGGGEGDRMLPVQRPRANGGGLFDAGARNPLLSLRDAEDAVKPTIKPASFYKSAEQLINMKEKHRHPNHGVKMVKADYQNESDKQHWSHLRKIYRRIDDVLEERDEIHTQLEAARHIDKHERAEMSLLAFVKYLRDDPHNKYNGKYCMISRKRQRPPSEDV